ncbi:protein phosphatase 2C domain-containing protein [Metabacillus iocasae]|uniref:Serine/threonine protein phosphatase PrpC n=1 Tax=Priestia iocasae TaxID=2291674 RepID=A0ABS2QTZ4_9BACI|nr:protein phosphatase 2C domain-containing protein [Metabacillus iocasae]MBM7702954.1 serine/threonine protein phosphatase PrpC [Metabacillus iocasae]
MKIETCSIKSNRKSICEDHVVEVRKKGLFAVLDGATPVSDFVDEKGYNGAVLASRIVGAAIQSTVEPIHVKPCLVNANAQLLEKMKCAQIPLQQKHERWSTCAAVVHLTDDRIHYGQIGDCMIFATLRNGDFLVLSTDTVEGISKRAKQHRERERLKGVALPDESYFNVRKNALIYNRSLANVKNGYGVLNGDPAADMYFHTGSIKREDCCELLLISDGLFPKDKKWEDMFQFISTNGLERYARDLVSYEEKHSAYQDDKTGIFIQLATNKR